MQKINRTDLIVGICGIFVSILSFTVFIPVGIGENAKVGWLAHPLFSRADFIPEIWSSILLISSMAVIFESTFKRGKAQNPKTLERDPEQSKNVGVTIFMLLFIMCLYIVLLQTLGFIISTIITLSMTIWLFGYKNFYVIFSASVTISGVLYIVFTKLLYVKFPGMFI